MSGQYYVYIVTNKHNTVLYTGITNDLKRRIYEHLNGLLGGFTEKYNISKLVYCESFGDARLAITREKQIKAGSRNDKIKLVEDINKDWKDLYAEL